MTFYKCIGDKDYILFISSKNQKFSKTKPGSFTKREGRQSSRETLFQNWLIDQLEQCFQKDM